MDNAAGTVSVSGSSGKTVPECFEDVRPSIVDDQFAVLIRQANDALDAQLDGATDANAQAALDDSETAAITHGGSIPPHESELPYPRVHAEPIHDSTINPNHAALRTGNRIEVFWPINNAFYAGSTS